MKNLKKWRYGTIFKELKKEKKKKKKKNWWSKERRKQGEKRKEKNEESKKLEIWNNFLKSQKLKKERRNLQSKERRKQGERYQTKEENNLLAIETKIEIFWCLCYQNSAWNDGILLNTTALMMIALIAASPVFIFNLMDDGVHGTGRVDV